MAVKDKEYLFGKTTRKQPSADELEAMVMGIIPWSSPISTQPDAAFTLAGMANLLSPAPLAVAQEPQYEEDAPKLRLPLNEGKLPAGYTYWGQWIAHDIIPPTHPAQNHFSARQVTPSLNMDSLYGDIQDLPSHIYINEEGFFRLPDNEWDCLRDNCTSPILPEPRNNDNAIILQFHSQWQRIHNNVLSQIRSETLPHLCENSDYFHQARQITVALFHRLTVQEWLKAVLEKPVFDYYFGSEAVEDTLLDIHDELTRVPLEFSHAAFRFGHSMVRETYKLRGTDSFNLHALLTHQPFNGKPIPPIDWSLFFGEFAQEVQPINLIVVAGMGGIPVSRNIAERNIVAGMKAELMTVQECKLYLETHHPALFKFVGLTLDDSEALLTELKIDTMNQDSLFYTLHREGRLPLWPYILTESAVQEDNPGHRLGTLGSIIVAEVMRYALHQARQMLFSSEQAQQQIQQYEEALCASLGLPSPDLLTMSDLLCKRS